MSSEELHAVLHNGPADEPGLHPFASLSLGNGETLSSELRGVPSLQVVII